MIDMSNFTPGDQISIGIYFKGNPFTHHGIYVGDYYLTNGGTPPKKDGVIHFEKTHALGEVKIKHTNLEGFAKGRERLNEIKKVNNGRGLPSLQVVENALKCAQKYEGYGNNIFKKFFGMGYNMSDFNCEHLATECKFGYKESKQGDLLKMILTQGPAIQAALQKMR